MKEGIDFIHLYMNDKKLNEKSLIKWTDWRWQIKNSIKKIETVEKILNVSFSEEKRKKLQETIDAFPMAITPYYMSLVDPSDYENDPVFKQAFPDTRELKKSDAEMLDPLAEEKDSPVIGITHRYPDRVLFHVSNLCAMYCRHCTRKRKVGDKDSIPSKADLLKGIEYIKKHTEVRDVLLSGGDPLMLPDEHILFILDELTKIDHVEVIRIGTRTPVVLPFRITNKLIDSLSKYDNLWINTHYNHPKELTYEAKTAIKKLTGVGIPLGNQSVLLADINDCPRIMKKLVQKLVHFRVRPYYIYQCDLSEGLEHFRTSVGKGIEIMENLRGYTSGFAVPTYVIDAPGGGGKIPVGPNYIVSWSTNKVILRNYEGVITTYREPDCYKPALCDLNCTDCNLQFKTDTHHTKEVVGINKLLADYDDTINLTPVG
ncbi:L-lysine 2,3-aminomutase [Alkalibaculum bacchi]|uniref:L-lysine 2,3-aminomutase n=1 Tax=Alkalibaculum bacchi TaxID=645887 RepID=A0A366IAH3_9FIRM|nr:lysine 2,3-aminomutase [Alkalibaculum bacchi]RBP65349.1 L-lysine 2,3-aminomutase [Alkalibaculum bacchi]